MSNQYTKYKKTAIWSVLEKAISDLIENQDIEQKTQTDYIVGYLVKSLIQSKCYKDD